MEHVRNKPTRDTSAFFQAIAGFAIAGGVYALQLLDKGGLQAGLAATTPCPFSLGPPPPFPNRRAFF